MPTVDLSGDWQVIDNPITITYFVKTGEGAFAAGVTVNFAQRAHYAPGRVELAQYKQRSGSATLQIFGSSFMVWKAQLGGVVPKIGDYLTDEEGQSWVVDKMTPLDLNPDGSFQRYRLVCQSQLTT